MLPRTLIGFAFIVALLDSMAAEAVTLYKLVDSKGNVTYTESAPYGFDGKVIPVDIPFDANAVVPMPKPVAPDKAGTTAQAPEPDYLTKRRTTRAGLEARLKLARDNLESAKLALANATMEDDEFQVILKPVSTSTGRTPGAGAGNPTNNQANNQTSNQANCANVVRNGRMVRACGAVVPNEKFVDKMTLLELAVTRAEEEVEAAEIAWRRGVD